MQNNTVEHASERIHKLGMYYEMWLDNSKDILINHWVSGSTPAASQDGENGWL